MMHVNNQSSSNTCLVCLWQFRSSYNNMPKKGKKKAHAPGDDLEVDILPKVEIIYEDTKSIAGV